MNEIKDKAPLLTRLAEFISEFKEFEVDDETYKHSIKVLADTYGTAFSGIKTDAFKKAIINIELLFGKGDYNVWGTNEKTSLLGSIFYNSLAISSTDYDEGHRKAVGHPASTVVPVAMVLGKHLLKSEKEILKSTIIGYEIGTRFSMARKPENIITYSTGRWGAIAASATASYLLGLDANAISNALSNAAVLSPVMLGGSTDVSTGSMSKEGVAWSVQSGVQSALLAQNGFSGPYLFVDDHDDYINEILLASLGDLWLINTNYFKPYSCCRWLHSAVNATEEIRKTEAFDVKEIEKIEVFTALRILDLVGEKYPDNTVKAQFHLPFVVAVMLNNGIVSPDFFQTEQLHNTSILKLIDKIVLTADKNYTSVFPTKLPSRVEITLNSKKVLSKEILVSPWDYGIHPDMLELKKKFDLQVIGLEYFNWESFISDFSY